MTIFLKEAKQPFPPTDDTGFVTRQYLTQQLAQATENIEVAAAGRTILNADRTYYTRKDGNDTNDGRAAATAFYSLWRTFSELSRLDGRNFSITLNIGPGLWEEDTSIGCLSFTTANTLGVRKVTVAGAGMDQTTLRNPWSGRGLASTAPGVPISLTGVRFENTGSTIYASGGAHLSVGAIDFGPAAGAHLHNDMSYVAVTSNYKISGGGSHHILTQKMGMFECSEKTVTITGTPHFSVAFAACQHSSELAAPGNTYTGSATGKRYFLAVNSIIDTWNGGESYFPGNQSGTLSSDCRYV